MSFTKYIHLRREDLEGNILPHGGITVAYEEQVDGSIRYGVSYCSPEDNFCKHTGRMKSQGRMSSDKQSISWDEGSESDFRDYIYEVYGMLL